MITIRLMQSVFTRGTKCSVCGIKSERGDWIFWRPPQINDDTGELEDSCAIHWKCGDSEIKQHIIDHCKSQIGVGKKNPRIKIPNKYLILLSRKAMVFATNIAKMHDINSDL